MSRPEPTAATALDLSGVTCPMTFVRVTLALEALAAGDRLEVVLDAGEPATEVPRSVALHGHAVEATTALPDGRVRLRVRKG